MCPLKKIKQNLFCKMHYYKFVNYVNLVTYKYCLKICDMIGITVPRRSHCNKSSINHSDCQLVEICISLIIH